MPVTNPLAITFANEAVRPLAENFTRAYYEALSFLDFWNTNNGNGAFPVGGGLIDDNSGSDGRTPITSDDVRAFKDFTESFVAGLNANSDEELQVIIKPSVRVK